MLRPFTYAAAFSLTAGAAFAACPGPEDLTNGGIWIAYADDWMTYNTRTEKGTTLEVSEDGADEPYWIESYDGVYVVADGNMKNGQILPDRTTTYGYAVPLEQLPKAAPGLERTDQVTVDNTVPDDPETAKQIVRIGPATTITIGACTYDSIVAHVIFDKADNDGYTYAINVLQGLDIAVLSASGTRDGGYDAYYKAVSISTERPR